MSRLSLKSLLIVLVLILIPIILLIRINQSRTTASAAWYNDSWLYRQSINVSSHSVGETNVYITTALTIGSTTKANANDGDFRFTTSTGQLLNYYIVSGAGTTTINFHILIPTYPAGAQTLYAYYGNPSAPNGFSSADFTTAASGSSIGSYGSEEVSQAPVAYWKFDEGVGTTIYNSSNSLSKGFLGTGSSSPNWLTEDQCIVGKCLYFNGSNNNYASTNDVSFNYNNSSSISLWIKPNSASTGGANKSIIGKNPQWEYTVFQIDAAVEFHMWNNAGADVINARTPSILTANTWTHLTITYNGSTHDAKVFVNGVEKISQNIASTTFQDRTDPLLIGQGYTWGTSFFTGAIDEVKFYQYLRTPAQINTDYNAGKSHTSSSKGINAALGGNTKNAEAFSNGLIGYWKFDENIGTTTLDSSGNTNTATFGTGSSAPTWGTGKYGVGLSFNATNKTILSTGYTGQLGDFTVSLWFKDDGTVQNFERLIDKNYAAGFWLGRNNSNANSWGGGIIEPGGNYGIYGTFPDNQWNHLVSIRRGTTHELYANGVLVASNTVPSTALDTTPLNFGNGPTGQALGGLLDEVRLYNRALTPNEVTQLYNYAPGPVGYWKFDEGTGTTAFDSSGNGINAGWAGTLGSQWTTGKFNGAGNFNGTNNYVSTGITSSYQAFTAQTWFRFNTSAASERGIFTKYVSGFQNGLWTLEILSGNTLLWDINDGAQKTCQVAVSPNQWYNAAAVYTGSQGILYLNGTQACSFAVGTIATIADEIRIGHATTGRFFGQIDDTRFYNYARTPKQIVEDMNAGHPAGSSPVGSQVGYYKFDEGYGSITQNSGNAGVGASAVLIGTTLPIWTNDAKFGKGLYFNGIDNYVRAPSSIGMSGAFTITVWAKQTAFLSNPSAFAKVIVGGNGNNCDLYDMGTNYAFYAGSNFTLTPPSMGVWNHIALTVDGTNGNFYLNGVLKNTSSTIASVCTNKYIGGGVASRWFNGYIDEVKIYNSALTADEIKIDYNRGSAISANSFASANTGNTAPASANSQLYCVPGDATTCAPPVAEWNFDEGTGTTAYDKSGNGIDASLKNSPVWAPGKFNSGINFTAAGQYLDAGTSPTTGLTTAGTLEAWIKPSSYPPNGVWKVLAARGTWGGGRNYYSIYYSGWNSMLNFGVGNSTTNCLFAITQNTTPLNVFSHLTLTWNTVGTYAYMNGLLLGSAASCTPDTTGYTLSIGGITGSYGAVGILDQVRIFNYARSPAQVALDYNRGGPIGWWKFDDCQGSVAYDSSGIGNSGLITIGAGGSQTSVGTCGVGGTTAWGVGASGKINSSLNFDGTDDYVDAGTAPMFNFINNPFSLSAWIKPTNTVAYHNIMGKGGFWANDEYQMYIKDGNLFNYVAIGGTRYNTPAYPVSNGIWYHVTGVYNGSYIVMYVNGAFFGQTAVSNLNLNNTTAFRIGSGNSDRFTGQIDNVRVYNYALTGEQIKLLYNNNGAVRFAPNTGSP